MSRRAPLALVLAASLLLATTAGGCRYADHKYWSLPLSEAFSHTTWRASWPTIHDFIAALAFFIDLPLLPVTLLHDAFALFLLEDEGTGGGPTPSPTPGETPTGAPPVPADDGRPRPGLSLEPPPEPPSIAVTVLDAGQPAQDEDWSPGGLEVERVE
jgi:hypothetical protein